MKTKKSTLASRVRLAVVPISLLLASFAMSPNLQAVSPPPDGGYPGANTAEGSGALLRLTDGNNNTALGSEALFSVTFGSQNTATGAQALKNNTASDNTANGFQALVSNTTGLNNTATGWRALYRNTTGTVNTANGARALYLNTTGVSNTATGYESLVGNSTGSANTATGTSALYSHTVGDQNTATGAAALSTQTTGSFNTSDGAYALFDLTIGSHNIALGAAAGCRLTSGNNNIYVGNLGGNESNTIRIGTAASEADCFGLIQPPHTATYIGGIFGAVSGGSPVYVGADGKLGTSPSSVRFKTQIQQMGDASQVLFALKPVSFRYRNNIDPAGRSQFGLIAEDVEKVSSNLVVRDARGKPYSVRYDAVNAMLLNEFLKEHRKNEEQEATIARLDAQIGALTAGLQKVTAYLEVSKTAPRTVVHNP